MEVTKEMLEEANRYWEAAEERIIKIAAEMGVDDIKSRKYFEGFLYDMFPGDTEPTDAEIKEAIEEFLTY